MRSVLSLLRRNRRRIEVQVVKRFTLNGTIDAHDPIGVTFRVLGPEGPFRITFVSVNWGRGYDPGEFKRNVLQVLDATEERQYVVLLIQELDEADAGDEHKVLRESLEPGSTMVQWFTREPIVVSPGVPVTRSRRVMTMDQGSVIGAPLGTGPRRFFTSCIIAIDGIRIGVGNQHPHRKMPNAKVVAARRRGIKVTRSEVRKLLRRADMAVYGGDMNDLNYPKAHPRERVGVERGLDTIRYTVA